MEPDEGGKLSRNQTERPEETDLSAPAIDRVSAILIALQLFLIPRESGGKHEERYYPSKVEI